MSNAKFIIGETGGQIDLSISPSTPSAPSSGYVSMWTDGEDIYMVNSAGTNILVGVTGAAGTSGTSGINGTSGTSGINGTSGTSGINGTSGTSGVSGTSGTSGISGATGPVGPTGSVGLAIKNIQWGGTAGWGVGTAPDGSPNSSYYDVTFSSSFSNTNYTTDFYYYEPGSIGSSWYANGLAGGAGILFSNKTVSGIRVWITGGYNISTGGSSDDIWNLRATAIGEA